MFPDKTSQVWKQSEQLLNSLNDDALEVEWEFENEGEYLHLLQFFHLAHHLKCKPKTTNIYLPYMPYARQDKEISNESCFALSIFLRALPFSKVTMFDVHNPDFFKNLEDKHSHGTKYVNILPTEKVQAIVTEHAVDTIVFPDKGAESRYGRLLNVEAYAARKDRDQLTGEIRGLVMDIAPPEGSTILVWDDLCDGARSFTELAKILLPLKPAKLILYVSHGIFSKGTEVLFDAGYDFVYTKDGPVTCITHKTK
jgi:ribose-phosphate pyrophosphokinase